MRNPNPLETERELKTSLLGINGTDPFFRNNSAARRAMNATQIGQALVIEGTKPRNIFTGLEKRFGEDTFNCSFPCDATVIEVIRRYTPGIGEDSIRENPETLIVYEDYNDPYKTVSVLLLKKYESFHTEFGYPLKPNPHTLERLSPGANFAEGEVLADSIAVGADGNYSVGTKAQVCFMSHPGTIEDGFVVRKGFLKDLTAHRYQTVVGSFGSKYFPLNLFGRNGQFKAFPDIGDVVGEDGILMAFREVDPELGVADMTPRALREVNHDFDRVFWAKPGARVIDVKVVHDERLNPSPTPTGMDEQARKYYDAQSVYYRRLLDVYERLKRQRKGALRISPEFNQLLVEALTYLPVAAHERKLTKMYKLETLDEWRVEITYDWPIEVGQGMKASDFGGGKGVFCRILDDEAMPVDQWGKRADVLIYGVSTYNRMIMGRWYDQFFTASADDLTERLRREVGIKPFYTPTDVEVNRAVENEEWVNNTFESLMQYYSIVAPLMPDLLRSHPDPKQHVRSVLKHGIYLYIPPDSPNNFLESARELMKSPFCPNYGPVTYRDQKGDMVTTKHPVLIGGMQFMLLEKTAEDWSGVASVKIQHFGIPAKLNQHDRNTSPGREQSVRALGESETRSYNAYVGPETTMELLDRSNSPDTHRHMTQNILEAPKPTNIESVVDREQHPFGGSRPVAITHHYFNCRGIKFVHKPQVSDEGSQ